MCNVDIKRMSKETGIAVLVIKEALGIKVELPECNASTVEEAKKAWRNAPEGSEESKAALLKWIELASTVEEAEKVWRKALVYSDERKAALLKWIELASTVEEAEKAWRNAPEGSEEMKVAIRKLAEFFPKEDGV